LMEGTTRAAGRLAELRLDTDLDISHAVVRYLELLKLAALIAHDDVGDGQGMAEACATSTCGSSRPSPADQREIFTSSLLDEYLLDAERDVRRRAHVVAPADEPSLARFLPMRGDGVLLSATDIGHLPRVSAALQVCARVSDPQAHAAPALRDCRAFRCSSATHGQEDTRISARWPSSLPLLTRAGAGRAWRLRRGAPAAPEAPPRSPATTERAQEGTGPPCVVQRQSPKLGPARWCRGRSTGSTGLPGRRYE